jgi:hypothetical protein
MRLSAIPMWLVALVITAIGIVFIYLFPSEHLVSAIGEALIVAGVLALFVDPFLKRHLFVEASRGIFIHLLGFEHRPEVKDKLKDLIFGTKLLRSTQTLRCHIEVRADGFFDLTVDYHTEIINPTNIEHPSFPSMEFDKAHKAEILQMSFTSADGKYKWQGPPELKNLEPGVDLFVGKTFKIQPESKGIIYSSDVKYKILLRHGYSHFHYRRPVLRTMLYATPPPGYEASATPATAENKNYWLYDSIKMTGEHITLRWRKVNGEW